MDWGFWSQVGQVIQTGMVVVLLPMVLRQFFLQVKSTRVQTISTVISWVQAEEIRESRRLLYTLEREKSISRLPAKEWEETWKLAADRVSQCFNSAAIITLLDPSLEKLWVEKTKSVIPTMWNIVQPRIRERREMAKDQNLWQEFGWLAERATELSKK